MKEFNLEEAKKGKQVCTRNGRPARIICWDRKTENGEFSILALVTDPGGINESPQSYTNSGKWHPSQGCHDMDLIMETEKKEGWVNLYRDTGELITGSTIFGSEEIAKEFHDENMDYFGTTKIEWEE